MDEGRSGFWEMYSWVRAWWYLTVSSQDWAPTGEHHAPSIAILDTCILWSPGVPVLLSLPISGPSAVSDTCFDPFLAREPLLGVSEKGVGTVKLYLGVETQPHLGHQNGNADAGSGAIHSTKSEAKRS